MIYNLLQVLIYVLNISGKEEVVVNHLEPKEILDKLRYLWKGKTEPMADLSDAFNIQTRDGRNMSQYLCYLLP